MADAAKELRKLARWVGSWRRKWSDHLEAGALKMVESEARRRAKKLDGKEIER